MKVSEIRAQVLKDGAGALVYRGPRITSEIRETICLRTIRQGRPLHDRHGGALAKCRNREATNSPMSLIRSSPMGGRTTMKTLRFCLAWLIAGLALVAFAPTNRAADAVSEEEALKIGTEAYIYGYSLVTMEMTRRVMTNTDVPKHNHAPMGQFATWPRTYPDACVQGRHRPQRRHPVLVDFPGRLEGALRAEPAGPGRPLLPDANAGRLDQRIPGSRQAHYRRQGPEVRDHRPELEGYASGECHGVQVAHQFGVDSRPYLLHRHCRRLQGRA